MKSSADKDWKVISDGHDSENIPLWKALAQFTSDDLDDGLKKNTAVINQVKPPFVRYYNTAFFVSMGFGFFFIIFLLALLISAHSSSADLFSFLTIAALLATAAPHLWRQIYQYGLKTPDAPLELPHAPDRHFDGFLNYLQKVDAPQAYYVSRFGKRRKPLYRRQFFGRLRYFLFSEHSADRGMVMRFRTGLSQPADIFLHSDDVEKIIAMSRPKRKGGPGRKTKYRYNEAIISLIGDTHLKTLDLNNRTAAMRAIINRLSEWFEVNADASGDVPRSDLLSPHAAKIYERLKFLASLETE